MITKKLFYEFSKRNLVKSVKVAQSSEFKISDIEVVSDKERGTFNITLKIESSLNFTLPKVKLVLHLIPSNLKRKDDNSHLSSAEKYSIIVGDIQPGITTHKLDFKGKNGGAFKIEDFYLRVAKYSYQAIVPEYYRNKEIVLTVK